jgi:hypothetical protein
MHASVCTDCLQVDGFDVVWMVGWYDIVFKQ